MGVMSLRRLVVGAVVSLCALAGGLLLVAPVALAVTPPVVEEEAVLDVASTSATFQAKIDPEGSETTYRFEYGTSEAYESSIPLPDGLVGSGSAGVMVSAHPQDLQQSTTYHYRVLALVASRSETVPGSDGTFTTQSAGSDFALPDGRQWELVTPPNKHGAPISPISETGVIQAAEDGGAMTYVTFGPTELEPRGNASAVQVFSKRGVRGWSSKDIATPHSEVTGIQIGIGFEYRFFSADLSQAVVEPRGPFTSLSPEATERTPYIRSDSSCEAMPATCYTPLVSAANVGPGVEFGNEHNTYNTPNPTPIGEAEFVGATPDFSHVAIGSNVALSGTPGEKGLYEWGAGRLQLVDFLPESEGGAPAAGFLGTGESDVARHALSDDGSRIFWTRGEGEQGLYMRDTVKRETVRIGTFGKFSKFQTASSSGSRVFFGADGEGSEESYGLEECDVVEVVGKLVCDATRLAPDLQGDVLGASEDGSYVYFVSNSVLAADAVSGTCNEQPWNQPPSVTCNLYAMHNNGKEWEAPKLIAVLSAADYPDWSGNVRFRVGALNHLAARVSPDGRWVAFMSQRGLTGYDTRDAVSGQPDEEVYLYNFQSGTLACASCNPTGARPTGRMYGQHPLLLGGGDRVWSDTTWVAANIPGWTPYSLDRALYQSRYLSDSGRLFFNSGDALVPQDVNGTWDVYEFEPLGVGSCGSASATFSDRSGGCASLISSGSSAEESAFMDASGTGDDVFFLTASRLRSDDVDTAYDIYDAHVCSAGTPCFTPPVSPPPCSTGDSCKAAPSLQPAIFGAPSSSTFAGAGNVVVVPAGPGVVSKALTRAQKLARALRACRKKRQGRRASCERTARKLYGARQSGKAKATSKGER
jgi:hypothetical protein